jgi:transcriptional regulator with XRE-family HTH domain
LVSRRTVEEVPPLRAIRQARGLSLTEAARRARLEGSYLWRIEHGERRPSLRTLAKLAEVYGDERLLKALEPYVND